MEFSYLNDSSDNISNYDQFLKDITLLVEQDVPTKQCSKKESKLKGKPWINYRNQKMMRIRGRISRKLRKKDLQLIWPCIRNLEIECLTSLKKINRGIFKIVSPHIAKI